MPALGLGTFGSDNYTTEQIAEAVVGAASVGYRHFDCASVYGNEDAVGRSLQAIMQGGVPREDLWITSKVWNDKHGHGHRVPAGSPCGTYSSTTSTSISSTGPSPIRTAKAWTPHSRDPHAKAYLHDDYMQNVAADGAAGGHGPGPAHRHVQHDHPQAGTAPARRDDQARRQRDGTAPPFPAARTVPVCRRTTASCPSATRPSARRRAPSATGRPTTPWTWKTPSSSASPGGSMSTPPSSASSGRSSTATSRSRSRSSAPSTSVPCKRVVGDPLTDEEMQAIAGIDKNNRSDQRPRLPVERRPDLGGPVGRRTAEITPP